MRDVDTPKFAGMRGRQRRRAVRGVFRCVQDFGGMHVLALDDVMTSGASLHAAAQVLLQAGATQVSALVLARTGLGEDDADHTDSG